MTLDDAFWPALWALAVEAGTRPEVLLAVWYTESGLQPSARNPQSCIGLNQSCPTSMGGPGFPQGDPEAYAAAPASAQLAWIRPQVLSAVRLNGGPLRSAARYYQANFLPATLASAKAPRDPIAGKAGPYAAAYAANAALDATGDGVVTLDDLGLYLQRRVASGAGALESAIARAYAARPSNAPWSVPDLVLFEPADAPPLAVLPRAGLRSTAAAALAARAGGAPLVAGTVLVLALVLFGRRA
jgi:hypothetical protein